jgi:hypothetical protein
MAHAIVYDAVLHVTRIAVTTNTLLRTFALSMKCQMYEFATTF